jgi:DNA replication and repair protein RecF
VFVRHLSLADFRSWRTAEIAFDPGPSVLVGANGQGKTNLVEAIGYLSTLGSHRVALDAPLVRAAAQASPAASDHGPGDESASAGRAVVRAAVVSEGRELLVEVEISPGRANKARINRAPVPRPRDVLGILRTVLFAPEDLAIVRGDPSERRRFLDDLLVQRRPSLAGVRLDYDRVLKQRGALLKTAGMARRSGGAGDLRTLDVWDGHLAAHGSVLLGARLELVEALAPHVAQAYRSVALAGPGGSSARSIETRLQYVSSLGDGMPELGNAVPPVEVLEAALLAELARRRPQEIERGLSLVGPHRDDLELRLGDLPVRGYASHGESWSVALALRLGSFELLRSGGASPVLLLDDVFAELDGARRAQLAALVASAEQVLVTAAVPEDVPPALDGARFDVYGGEVRRVR